MINLGKLLITSGLVLALIGGIVYLAAKSNIPIGHLPGDIHIERGNSSCFIALGTSILLSIILTILINVIARLQNR